MGAARPCWAPEPISVWMHGQSIDRPSGDVGSQAAIDDGKQSTLLTNIFIGAGALVFLVGASLWLFGVIPMAALLPIRLFHLYRSPVLRAVVFFSKGVFDDAQHAFDSGFCLIGL